MNAGKGRSRLTGKEEQFCLFYVEIGNATEAHRRAYPSTSSQSDRARWVAASRILDRPHVAQRIEKLRAATAKAAEVKIEDVLRENARVALSDIRKVLTNEGCVRSPAEWDAETAAVVSSYRTRTIVRRNKQGEVEGEERYVEIKLWDKGAAIDRMLRHFGAYEKDNRQLPSNIFDGVPREQVKMILAELDKLKAADDSESGSQVH